MLHILFHNANANGLFGNQLNCSFLSGRAHVSSLQNLLADTLVLMQHLSSEMKRKKRVTGSESLSWCPQDCPWASFASRSCWLKQNGSCLGSPVLSFGRQLKDYSYPGPTGCNFPTCTFEQLNLTFEAGVVDVGSPELSQYIVFHSSHPSLGHHLQLWMYGWGFSFGERCAEDSIPWL